jgi:hypothetical protein
VVDDESRENEGDFIMAADLATPETMATMIRYTSGVICIGMEGSRMDALKLPPMLTNNEDPKGTAFSVTVDATTKHGTSLFCIACELDGWFFSNHVIFSLCMFSCYFCMFVSFNDDE